MMRRPASMLYHASPRSGRADRRSNWRRVAPRSSAAGSGHYVFKFFFIDTASQASARAAATLCAFSAAVPHIPRHPTHSPHLSSRGTVARRAIIKVGEMPPMYTAVAGFIAPITLLYTYIIRASCPPGCRRCRRALRGGWDPAPRGEPLNMTEGSRRPSLPTPAPTHGTHGRRAHNMRYITVFLRRVVDTI